MSPTTVHAVRFGESPRARSRTARPVVLVHGFGGSRKCWATLARALDADGRTVTTFDYSPWASSVEGLADRLVETIDDLLTATGADRVDLVGHSLGGVIIAQALTHPRLAGLVDLVVTLGSPFGGSPWAGLFPMGPLVRAVRPGSALLRRLAAAAPPEGVRWLAFVSSMDVVVPAERAVPATWHATRVTVDAAGHCGMLEDSDVIAHIVASSAVCGDAVVLDDLIAA